MYAIGGEVLRTSKLWTAKEVANCPIGKMLARAHDLMMLVKPSDSMMLVKQSSRQTSSVCKFYR